MAPASVGNGANVKCEGLYKHYKRSHIDNPTWNNYSSCANLEKTALQRGDCSEATASSARPNVI